MTRAAHPWIHLVSGIGCALVTAHFAWPLVGTELSGGVVTGPLIDLQGVAVLVFLLSSILGFVQRRLAIALAGVACLISLPIPFYLVAPGPFRAVVPGNYKDWHTRSFFWDAHALGASAAVIGLTIVTMLKNRPQSPSNQ